MKFVEEGIFHILISDISGGIRNNYCHLGVLVGGRGQAGVRYHVAYRHAGVFVCLEPTLETSPPRVIGALHGAFQGQWNAQAPTPRQGQTQGGGQKIKI